MIKKVGAEQLTLGMYVHSFCGSWLDHPFWRNSFLIDDVEELKKIQTSGVQEVFIDTEKGRDIAASAAIHTNAPAQEKLQLSVGVPVEARTTSYQEELVRASLLCKKSMQAVSSMFDDARMGKAVDTEGAKTVVTDISNSISRNPGAFISLARLKNADNYTYMHSVAVCALMVSLANQLGLDDQQRHAAGLAGLMHDLGKALIPIEILNKPGALSAEDFETVKLHANKGYALLADVDDMDPAVLDVCLHHHERIDGGGYPHRLKGAEIGIFAKMGAVCDIYDAITSDRPYKAGWGPADALRKMATWTAGHIDQRIFQAFVKSIGIYPNGSLVKLDSGKLGVVVEQSNCSLIAPKVKVFFSTKSKLRIVPEVIDLSNPHVQSKILSWEDHAAWGFSDLNAIWLDGAPLPA